MASLLKNLGTIAPCLLAIIVDSLGFGLGCGKTSHRTVRRLSIGTPFLPAMTAFPRTQGRAVS
jgi:hypothetical protein